MKFINISIALVLLLTALAFADTLEFSNGKTLEGTLIGRSNNMVQFESNGITGNYAEQDVKNIAFDGPAPATGQAAPVNTPAPQAEAKSADGAVTVTAGTLLHVRTREGVNTRQHKAGHKFTAELEADLVSVNGVVVALRGSTLYGELMASKQAGRLAGKSEMTVNFTGIMINNQIKPIRSGAVKAVAQSGSGKETVGRTARIAAVGALADGNDGAKTGAKIGLGAAVLSRGGNIDIPAGTLLDVPLADALTL